MGSDMNPPKEPQPSQGAGAEERCMACIGDEFTTGHCKKCGRGRNKNIHEEAAERLGIECYIHPPDPIRGAIPTQRFTDFMSGWHIGYHRGLDVVDAQKDRRIQDLIDAVAELKKRESHIDKLWRDTRRLVEDTEIGRDQWKKRAQEAEPERDSLRSSLALATGALEKIRDHFIPFDRAPSMATQNHFLKDIAREALAAMGKVGGPQEGK